MAKEKKKVVKGETLVNFILDKSGSMESVRSATISGFNEYLNTLKKDGNKYSFSLTLFDTGIKTPFLNVPINDVKELNSETYNPTGGTSLYDAVCITIKSIKEKKGQKVINIIMTDGQENSSKEFSEVDMKKLIKEKEKGGNWSFVYLGANQDSYANAARYGFAAMNTSNYQSTERGTAKVMSAMAVNTSSFAGNDSLAATCNFFSETDQKNLETDVAVDESKISAHFSSLGKKSWEARKKGLSN